MDVPLLREGKPVSWTEIAQQVAKSRRAHSLLLDFYEDVNLLLSCCGFDCLFLFFQHSVFCVIWSFTSVLWTDEGSF